jgi:hypothetical protein
VVVAIIAVGVIGADFMPTVNGAMPKPGGWLKLIKLTTWIYILN